MKKDRDYYYKNFKVLFEHKSDEYLLGYFDCLTSVLDLYALTDLDFDTSEVEYSAIRDVLLARKLIK